MLGGRPPGPASVSETTCLLIYIQDDQSQGNQRAPTMAGHAPLFSGSLDTQVLLRRSVRFKTKEPPSSASPQGSISGEQKAQSISARFSGR